MTELKHWSAISSGPHGAELFILRGPGEPSVQYITFRASTRAFRRNSYEVGGFTQRPIDPAELPPEAVAEALAYALTRGRH